MPEIIQILSIKNDIYLAVDKHGSIWEGTIDEQKNVKEYEREFWMNSDGSSGEKLIRWKMKYFGVNQDEKEMNKRTAADDVF